MRISPLDLERATVGAEPRVIERFFIQRTHEGDLDQRRNPFRRPRSIWADARIDVNTDGCVSHDQALTTIERLYSGEFYPSSVKLRVIRRTLTIETEVAEIDAG